MVQRSYSHCPLICMWGGSWEKHFNITNNITTVVDGNTVVNHGSGRWGCQSTMPPQQVIWMVKFHLCHRDCGNYNSCKTNFIVGTIKIAALPSFWDCSKDRWVNAHKMTSIVLNIEESLRIFFFLKCCMPFYSIQTRTSSCFLFTWCLPEHYDYRTHVGNAQWMNCQCLPAIDHQKTHSLVNKAEFILCFKKKTVHPAQLSAVSRVSGGISDTIWACNR